MDEVFSEQMLDWLEYASENLSNHRTVQTPRFARRDHGIIGNNLLNTDGGGYRDHINTWTLYQAWKAHWVEGHPDSVHIGKHRVMVRYDEAVPELHALLDWLSEPEREAAEAARKSDRRRAVRNSHPLLDAITPKDAEEGPSEAED